MSAPRTKWLRDNGSIVEESTDVLGDELDNSFVDESDNMLLNSVSSDGLNPKTEWVEEYA